MNSLQRKRGDERKCEIDSSPISLTSLPVWGGVSGGEGGGVLTMDDTSDAVMNFTGIRLNNEFPATEDKGK